MGISETSQLSKVYPAQIEAVILRVSDIDVLFYLQFKKNNLQLTFVGIGFPDKAQLWSLDRDLQHALQQFAAECEAVEMSQYLQV